MYLKKKLKKKLYGWGSTASRLQPLRGGSLLLNLVVLPLGFIFYTTHSFAKKLTTVKTLEEKVFC